MREFLFKLQVGEPTAAWGLDDPAKWPSGKEIADAIVRHIEGESIGIGRFVCVIDSAEKTSVGTIEQDFENAQVRRMKHTGICPCCGADA